MMRLEDYEQILLKKLLQQSRVTEPLFTHIQMHMVKQANSKINFMLMGVKMKNVSVVELQWKKLKWHKGERLSVLNVKNYMVI